MRSRRTALAAVITLVFTLSLLGAGCGGSSSSSSASGSAGARHTQSVATSPAAMAKFVGHAGLAFGIFHRYVYKPFRAGALNDAVQPKLAFTKAGAAAAAASREVVLAKQDAQGSTALRKLYAPLAGLVPTLGNVAGRLDRGHPDPGGIKMTNGAIASIKQTARAAGVRIPERAPARNP
jgi:hypothetical protein